MDRDFLIDLFADFGPVTIRRMFSGFGISADGINFAMALRSGLYLRADDQTIPRFEAEGGHPKAGGNERSRHLAVDLGGVFRVGFADHAVAAVALGGVEAGVGALDQRVGFVVGLQHGNSDRYGDAAEDFAGGFLPQFLRHHGAADVIGDR